MDTWEQLNETRNEVTDEMDQLTDFSLRRAEVLAILYVGDCIRYLAGRPHDYV